MYATYWIASSAWGCRDCWLFPPLLAAVHTVLSRQEDLEQGRLPTLTETQGVAGGCGGLHQVHKRPVPVRYTPKYPCSIVHDELHLPPTKPSLSKNHGRMAHTPSYIRSQLECQILHRQQASAEFLSPIIPAHSRPVENKQIEWANECYFLVKVGSNHLRVRAATKYIVNDIQILSRCWMALCRSVEYMSWGTGEKSTGYTQAGTIPRSSPHASISEEFIKAGKVLIALSRHNVSCRWKK